MLQGASHFMAQYTTNRRGKKTKIQQRGDMNNTKLNGLLENISKIRRDVWE